MTTKRERAQLRERWKLQQKQRARIQAEIAKMEKRGASTAEIEDELGLWAPEMPPDDAFVNERLKGASTDEFIAKAMQATIDLVASDVPLSRRTRRLLAGELHRLYFPNPARDRQHKRQLEAYVFDTEKRILLDRGMTSAEAERAIAEERGITVAALRKKIQRANS